MALTDFNVLVVSWLLALIFAAACRHKITQWARFKASFAAYKLVPAALVSTVAAAVTCTEVVLVIGLVFLQSVALYAGAALLLVYLAAITINLARGRRNIDCGCGDEPTPLSLRLVLRNSVLVIMALGAALTGDGSALVSWQEGAVALIAALVGFGLYMVIEQLIANRGRHERLWLGVQ